MRKQEIERIKIVKNSLERLRIEFNSIVEDIDFLIEELESLEKNVKNKRRKIK